ncbi:Ig-like domain-containing protein [Candidatus Accumulibacter aalborgensis]|nr:Ig-like domain-containing protein [Candidatus Accumulibacter aalborgensis]
MYFVDALTRPTTTHATVLPPNVRLGPGSFSGSRFARVDVVDDAPSVDLVSRFVEATTGVSYAGQDVPLGNGAVAYPSGIVAGDVNKGGLFLHPPDQGQVGGETFAEYSVLIPAAGQLRFSVGVADDATCTDGVTFRVTVNGSEQWREHVLRTGWQARAVSLAGFSGTTVALRLISNPGPWSNPSCDWSLWSDVAIGGVPASSTLSVPLALVPGGMLAGFDGQGSPTLTSSSTVQVANVPVPGGFTVFTSPGTAVASGVNLASLTLETWKANHSDLLQPGPVFNDGTVGSVTSGGMFKSSAIFAHPPDGGRTALTWVLRLPSSPALALNWAGGISDAATSEDGVDASVRINGATYWTASVTTPGWRSGSMDLSRWAGKDVLIELVSDSRARFIFDWFYWADLTLTPSGASCTYGLPSGSSVGAGGGTLSIDVKTVATCSWNAVSDAAWALVTNGTGLGTGIAAVTLQTNPGRARTTVIRIAGQGYTITQAANPNAVPTTVDDKYVTATGVALMVAAPGVLQNDAANQGGPMTARLVDVPTHGVAVLDPDGRFVYTPAAGFAGVDAFTYRAASAGGDGNVATVRITVTDTTTPMAPTGLVASSIVGNLVTLRFTPPAVGAVPTGYVVEGGLNPGEVLGSIARGAAPEQTFTAPTGVFYVRVHTLAGAARSGPSNEIRIYVNVPTAASPPTALTGMANGAFLALAWRNTFGGGTPASVTLDVSGAYNGSFVLGPVETFTFSEVPSGSYTFRVRVISPTGTSAPSSAVTLAFPAACSGPPQAPTAFLAYRVGSSVVLSWDPPAGGPAPTGYVVAVSGAFAGTIPVGGRAISGVVAPGTYRLSVAGTNPCGTGAATAAQTVVVP